MNAKKTLSDLYMTWQCKTLEKFVDCFAAVLSRRRSVCSECQLYEQVIGAV